MTPKTIEDWSIGLIVDSLNKGIYETGHFEFQTTFLDKTENFTEEESLSIAKDCAGFANGGGGFLVYGVSRTPEDNPMDQLIGIKKDVKFQRNYGANFVKLCQPYVDWSFIAIDLPAKEEYAIYVVHIKASKHQPIGIFEDGKWDFPKRVNSENEPMPYKAIKDVFLNTDDLDRNIVMFLTEVRSIHSQASANKSELGFRTIYGVPELLDDRILLDVYPKIIATLMKNQKILGAIDLLRSGIKEANYAIKRFAHDMTLPKSLEKYNEERFKSDVERYYIRIEEVSERIYEIMHELTGYSFIHPEQKE